MVNDIVVKWIRDLVSSEFSAAELPCALSAFQQYLDLELSDLRYSTVINNMAMANDFEKLNYIKDFCDIEKFMKNLGDIVFGGTISAQMRIEESTGNKGTTLSSLYLKTFAVVPRGTRLNEVDPDDFTCGHQREFLKVYQFRNSDIHNHLTDLNPRKIMDITASMLVCVLDLCYQYKDQLNEEFTFKKRNEDLNIKEYCSRIVDDYKKSKFRYLDIRWYDTSIHNGQQFTVNDVIRIDDYTNAKFLGEAGVGKTTALKRIEYNLAMDYIDSKTKVIPVYIELKRLSDREDIVKNAVIRRLSSDIPNGDDTFFDYKGLVLLLDGYNEVLNKQIQEKICTEINNIARNNPECRIFVSDRGKAKKNKNLLPEAIKLYLYPMSINEKSRYFRENINSSDDYASIEEKIKNQPLYFDVLDSPLKLKNMADVVNETHKIPDDLTDSYLSMLFSRESDKGDDNADYLKYFLERLAFDYEEKPMTQKDVLTSFAKVKADYGFESPDTMNCLKLITDLGILLVDEDGNLNFSTHEYFEHFLAASIVE